MSHSRRQSEQPSHPSNAMPDYSNPPDASQQTSYWIMQTQHNPPGMQHSFANDFNAECGSYAALQAGPAAYPDSRSMAIPDNNSTPKMGFAPFATDLRPATVSADGQLDPRIGPGYGSFEITQASMPPVPATSYSIASSTGKPVIDLHTGFCDRSPSSTGSIQSLAGLRRHSTDPALASSEFQTTDRKRRAQNREAQRAFRARKQQYTRDMERQLGETQEQYRQLQNAHERLKEDYDRLRRAVGLNAQEDIEARINTLKKLLESVDSSI